MPGLKLLRALSIQNDVRLLASAIPDGENKGTVPHATKLMGGFFLSLNFGHRMGGPRLFLP